MKKTTLLIMSLYMVSAAFAQSSRLSREADPRMGIDLTNGNMLMVAENRRIPATQKSQGTRDLEYVQLGSSSNGLTVLNNQCNVVVADNATQTVVFVHRNNASEFGGTSSQYRFDVSKDGGLTFLNDIGPLNPNTDGAGVGGKNGRYPQGAMINPSGAVVPDSVYLVYEGTWHNGASGLNTWDGTITGVGRVDGTASTYREVIDSVNHGNVNVFTSMCQGKPGEFWTITAEYDEEDVNLNLNDSNYVVLKGVWIGTTRNVEWTISRILNLPPELTYDGSTYDLAPLISFDPTGMKGWICITGDFFNDGIYVYQPVFFSTIDGGANWSEPTFLNLINFDNVMADLDPLGSGIPATAYEADLVVDHLGNPHYVNMIGSGIDYGFQSGLRFHAYDITYRQGSWEALRLDPDSIATFRGQVGTGSPVYTEDNRCQATTTPDGTKVFFSWIDTDPSLIDPYADYDNIYPNLFAIGLDVDTWKMTTVKSLTYNTDWDGRATMPNLAPVSLRNESTGITTIPVVIIEAEGSFEGVCDFWYFNNVTFSDSDFPVGIDHLTEQESFNVSANYPNPFSTSTQFTVHNDKSSDITVKVQNLLGATLSEQNYHFSAGKHAISISRESLTSGIYFYTVSSGMKSVTHKMVIE